MKESILLLNVSPEKLTELIKTTIKSQLQDFKKEISTHDPNELLTRDEALKFLKIDSSTLWHWTKKGKVKAYAIANRKYYKKEELLNCLFPIKNVS